MTFTTFTTITTFMYIPWNIANIITVALHQLLPSHLPLEDGRLSSIQSGSPSLTLRLWPWERSQKNKTSSEDWTYFRDWTRRHWNHRLSSIADNPDLGLSGLP